MGFRIVRRAVDHPLQAVPAFLKLAGFLQNDPEIVPGRRQAVVQGDRAARRLLAFRQQAALAAHLGQIAME